MNIIAFAIPKLLIIEGAPGKLFNIVCGWTSNVSGSLMAFWLLCSLARVIKWETPLFRSLSKASYPIYLFHQQIIYILLWNFDWDFNPWLSAIIIFVIASAISWVISNLLDRTKYTRLIIGKA